MNSAEPPAERRLTSRAATDRPAYFFSAHASLPRTGRVVNISLNGVAILTATPAPVGAHLELEIQPRDTEPSRQPIYVRGHVVRVAPVTPHECLMAVHLRVAPPEGQPYHPDRVDIGKLVADTVSQLETQGAPGAPVAFTEFQRQEASAPAEQEKRRRWTAPVIALLLLLFGAGWWIISIRNPGPAPTSPVATDNEIPGVPTPTVQISELIARAVQPTSESSDAGAPATQHQSDPGVIDEVSQFLPATPLGLPVAVGQAMLASGDVAGAEEVFEILATEPALPPVERVQASLGLAQAAWARADDAGALAGLARIEPELQAVDPVWQQAAALMRNEIGGGGGFSSNHVLADSIALAPAGVGAELSDGGRVALIVDKSAFVLQVMRGDAEIARFPVGLGFADSTPTGEFVVANKLVNPTWFNHGEPVPPGDPRNPLGARWVGLGRGGIATPYGIHGTTDPASIGAASSRGCIRMRPPDAEMLFAWCSVGTRVTIVP